MANLVGTVLLWIIAICMTAAFPLSEFARSMASAPPPSEGTGCIPSLIGLVLLALLVREALA